MLCSEGPVRNLAELSLVPEHSRSHGSVQRAMNDGKIDLDRLNWSFALRDLPRGPGGGIVLAVDVTPGRAPTRTPATNAPSATPTDAPRAPTK